MRTCLYIIDSTIVIYDFCRFLNSLNLENAMGTSFYIIDVQLLFETFSRLVTSLYIIDVQLLFETFSRLVTFVKVRNFSDQFLQIDGKIIISSF
jgi:predicted nucleic acid-binding protein